MMTVADRMYKAKSRLSVFDVIESSMSYDAMVAKIQRARGTSAAPKPVTK